jgi:hypothetical protein
MNDSVIQGFVIGVVEAHLLQLILKIPIHLSDEKKIRLYLPDASNAIGPERRDAIERLSNYVAPRAVKYLWLHQHRHIASHAIAFLGDSDELLDHGFTQVGIEVIKLQSIRPARIVRIAAMSENSTIG